MATTSSFQLWSWSASSMRMASQRPGGGEDGAVRVGSALGRGQGAGGCLEDLTAHGAGAGQGREALGTLARAAPGPWKEARVSSHVMPGEKAGVWTAAPSLWLPSHPHPAVPGPTLNREVDNGVGRHCKMRKEAS